MDVDESVTGRPSRVKRPPERFNVVSLAQAFEELEESERTVSRRASTSATEGPGAEMDDDDNEDRDRMPQYSDPEEDSAAEDAYVDSDEEAAKVEQAAAAKLEAMMAVQQTGPRVDKGKGRAVEPDLSNHLVEYEVR